MKAQFQRPPSYVGGSVGIVGVGGDGVSLFRGVVAKVSGRTVAVKRVCVYLGC